MQLLVHVRIALTEGSQACHDLPHVERHTSPCTLLTAVFQQKFYPLAAVRCMEQCALNNI